MQSDLNGSHAKHQQCSQYSKAAAQYGTWKIVEITGVAVSATVISSLRDFTGMAYTYHLFLFSFSSLQLQHLDKYFAHVHWQAHINSIPN